MESIYNYTFSDLEKKLIKDNIPKFRAKQIFDFLYKKKVSSFSEMKNIGKDTITYLNNNFIIDRLKIIKEETAKDKTTKFLFKLNDNNLIESVIMPHEYGNSVCISTEVGCLIGCSFCASGLFGRKRSLTLNELVLQIIEISKKVAISSVVLMGIGEPFLNYDNVISFIKILNNPASFGLGARKITVSTSGIVPKIKEFAKLDIQANLAISLHSPFDKIRDKLVPTNKKYKIAELIDSLKEYQKNTNRRIAIEYLMLSGVNDRKVDAKELVKLFSNMNVYFNLIPYNEVVEYNYKRSSKKNILAFLDYLKKSGFDVTIRKEYGSDINAACGQLRKGMLK